MVGDGEGPWVKIFREKSAEEVQEILISERGLYYAEG